ncbi:hypothetical protein RHM25_00015 [Clostridioides difficile]|nr:hypothetical protein [Clostridioides difficile]
MEEIKHYINYILTLQSNDFTVEEIRETIRVINKYVLKNSITKIMNLK